MAIGMDNSALMRLTTTLGAGRMRFRQMSAVEELARPFEFDVQALDESGAVEAESLLGKPACVTLQLPDDTDRCFHGLVCRMALESVMNKMHGYRLVLRPWLWLLTRRRDTRVFQKMRVDEVLRQVFEPYSADFEFRLSGSYEPYEYCVQYRETDFDFVSRLLEQEGIYYYFRHEKTRHTLMVVDNPGAHGRCPTPGDIAYRETVDRLLDIEAITQWHVTHEIQPCRASLADFDFEQPGTSMHVNAAAERPGARTKFDFYESQGSYNTRAAGQQYARVRIEELQVRYARVAGSGAVRALTTGATFTLKGHPRKEQNARHLVVSTAIEFGISGYESGRDATFYRCSFSALHGEERFRPQRITPKPHVAGVHTAIVVGPPGEEIHTDKYGRVKLQFHWDRHGKRDADSSCWVRVSHPWAGKGWGMLALPRVGNEVVVDFVEGDPDRPLVTGRVYNGDNLPPVKLPDHASVSTMRSRSTKGGSEAEFNELRFEDRKGGEYVWLQAQKDFYQYVKNDSFTTIDRNRFGIVKQDAVEHVHRDRKTVVGGKVQEHVMGAFDLTVGGSQAIAVDGKQGTKAAQGLSLESGASLSLKSSADANFKIGANLGMAAGANVHIKAGANLVIEAGAMINLKAGGSSIVIGPIVTITGALVNINSGGAPGAGMGANAASPGSPVKPQQPDEPKDPLK
ncbi:type VI secretion system spike protein VgrG1b [soil metagenome]